MEKSEMSFSRNIDLQKRNMLQMKSTFKAVENHDKYLGLPTFVGASKKQVFHSIQDRILKKLKGWKGGFLSQARRDVLIKSVAQAIPTYAMQVFSIPVSILQEIEKLCRSFFWGQKEEEKKISWVAWEKVCRGKKEGGLGFRDLKTFNNAMLAKQAWRCLTNEDSLMVKVLKKKYYPNTSLLEAGIPNNASYTWRSILGVRDVLKKGVRKLVGSGKEVKIWSDPWVPTLPNFKPLPRSEVNMELPYFVNELIEDGQWKKEYLTNIFSEWEVEEITKIIIPLYQEEDGWMWHHTKSGHFTVKSAYYIARQQNENAAPDLLRVQQEKTWDKLWKWKLLPKIKNFAWRAMHGGLAVRQNMMKRGIQIEPVCPRCGEEVEFDVHMLFTCSESRQIWYFSPLRLQVQIDERASIFDVVKGFEKIYRKEDWWSWFWNIAWGIWLNRNSWIFDQKRRECVEVIHRAGALVGEYEKVHNRETAKPPPNQQQTIWLPPEVGWFKANSVAAIFSEKMIGLGGVVRDHDGDVMLSTCKTEEVAATPDVAEALAARHVIKTAHEAGLRKLILELDCLILVQQLKGGCGDRTSLGCIVNDILAWAQVCTAFQVSFVRRTGNKVAHHLAKLGKSFTVCRVWLEEFPYEVNSYVMNDLHPVQE